MTHGGALFLKTEVRDNYPSWLIFPQCSENDRWPSFFSDSWNETMVKISSNPNKSLNLVIKLMDEFIEKKQVDKTRVYVSGLSMGGMGTFEILYRRPNMFAAATPICGNGVSNPVGLILGLVVAQQFVLKNLQSDDITDFSALDEASKILIKTSDLLVIRDPYVALGLLIILVFVLFAIVKMPNFKDQEGLPSIRNTFLILYKDRNYVLGILAQFLNVGAMIMCWTYIYQYAEAIEINSVTTSYYQMSAFILFTIGRAIGTYLLRFVSSGRLLMYFSLLAMVFVFGAIFMTSIEGLYSLVSVSFCMSLMFPTIYGIALGNLTEEQSKIGSAGLVMAIVGSALLPKLQGLIIDIGGSGVKDTLILGVPEINISFLLPLGCFFYIAFFGFGVFKRKFI